MKDETLVKNLCKISEIIGNWETFIKTFNSPKSTFEKNFMNDYQDIINESRKVQEKYIKEINKRFNKHKKENKACQKKKTLK